MFLPYAKQSINDLDLNAVSQALSADVITRGEAVSSFEKALSDYCGAEYAVAFNSGSSALAAAFFAAETNSSDTLITTPNTFAATVTGATQFGANPIFVDIDLETGNLNLDQLEATLQETKKTRGKTIIAPVHFSGIPVEMEKLESFISSPDTVVIEDAAHAIGSCYSDGKKVGCCSWSDMTMFSFHPAKTITTGEGGAVLTNSPELDKRLRLYRNNCIERNFATGAHSPFEGYYEVVNQSGNYNFTEFQAALGLSQLQRIDQFIEKRRELVVLYRKLLRDIPHLKLFTDRFDSNVAFHLFVVQIDFTFYNTTRAQVIQLLKEKGIGTQVHYIPIYRHPYFSERMGDLSEYFPLMEQYYSQALTLPLYYSLNEKDVIYVVDCLKEILISEKQKKKEKYRKSKV